MHAPHYKTSGIAMIVTVTRQTKHSFDNTMIPTMIPGAIRVVRSPPPTPPSFCEPNILLPVRSTDISTLPVYFQRWLAASDSDDSDDDDYEDDDDDDVSSSTTDQSSDSGTDYEYEINIPCHYPLEASPYLSQGSNLPVLDGNPSDPNDEVLEEEIMSFASKYLNLDYAASEHDLEAEIDPPPTSSNTSTGFASTPENTTGSLWERERPSASLLDDFPEFQMWDSPVTGNHVWPWGDYGYQPPSAPSYLDVEDYIRERELRKMEKKLRARLAERFEEEEMTGVRMVKIESRRESGGVAMGKGVGVDKGKGVDKTKTVRKGKARDKGKGRADSEEVETENSSPAVAFSRMIHGRTIYNP